LKSGNRGTRLQSPCFQIHVICLLDSHRACWVLSLCVAQQLKGQLTRQLYQFSFLALYWRSNFAMKSTKNITWGVCHAQGESPSGSGFVIMRDGKANLVMGKFRCCRKWWIEEKWRSIMQKGFHWEWTMTCTGISFEHDPFTYSSLAPCLFLVLTHSTSDKDLELLI